MFALVVQRWIWWRDNAARAGPLTWTDSTGRARPGVGRRNAGVRGHAGRRVPITGRGRPGETTLEVPLTLLSGEGCAHKGPKAEQALFFHCTSSRYRSPQLSLLS